MSANSVRRAGRINAGAICFFVLGAACATGSNDPGVDPVVNETGGTAGSEAGGTDAGGGGTPSAGTPAMAGKPSTGGSTTAGSGGSTTAGMGGKAGASSGGVGGGGGGRAGAGGVGGSNAGAGGMAGGGGAAGMAGSGAGMAGSGGSAPTGFRYAKLTATSELNGKVWSSVAELQIMTTGAVALSRSGWTVTADSEELIDQTAPATAAVDGDNASFWHTAWQPPPNDTSDAKLPHSLTIDMKTTQPITGFSYLPRQNNANGRIKDWQFFLSNDGSTWGTAVKTGSFPTGTALQNVVF